MAKPTMPSTGRPELRWKSATAADGQRPKMPSTRPVSNPRAPRRCWSSATSSPRSIGARRYDEPVPETESRLYQRVPGLSAADPVDPQAPAMLERLDRGRVAGPKKPSGSPNGANPTACQSSLDVGDRRPDRHLVRRGRTAVGTSRAQR